MLTIGKIFTLNVLNSLIYRKRSDKWEHTVMLMTTASVVVAAVCPATDNVNIRLTAPAPPRMSSLPLPAASETASFICWLGPRSMKKSLRREAGRKNAAKIGAPNGWNKMVVRKAPYWSVWRKSCLLAGGIKKPSSPTPHWQTRPWWYTASRLLSILKNFDIMIVLGWGRVHGTTWTIHTGTLGSEVW